MNKTDYIALAFSILFMPVSIYFVVMGYGKIEGLIR